MPKVDAKGKRLEASKFTYGDKDFKDYKDFEATYRPYAEAAVTKKMSEGKKIPVEVLLSQAYIESAGGRAPLNNNLSGLKASKSETNYGLYETTEFHKDEDHYKKFEKDGKFYADSVAFPPRKPGEHREIVSTKLVEDENSPNYGKYRYRVDSYFSHSNNVQEGFEKVIDNFYITPDYKTAVTNDDALNNPEIFLKSISGNYATEGGYYDIVSPYLNVSMETSKKIAEEKAAIENKAKQQRVQDAVDNILPEMIKDSLSNKTLAKGKIPFSNVFNVPKLKNGAKNVYGKVEAQGGELVVRNTSGDYAVIPKEKRVEALSLMSENNNYGLDELIAKLPKIGDYAEDGLIIGGDLSKLGSKVKPSADANTSNASTSTIQPVNPNINTSLIGKTWDDIPSTNPAYNQPQLKQDTRTDYEREQDQKAMEDYQNPTILDAVFGGARMVTRAVADPIQGVGQIFDAVGLGDTRIGQDLGNFNDEEAAYRYRNLNPNTSAGEKFMGNIGEGSEVAAYGATNFIPFESSVINPVVKGLVGKGNYSSYVTNQLYSPVVNQGVKEVGENQGINQVDDVVKSINVVDGSFDYKYFESKGININKYFNDVNNFKNIYDVKNFKNNILNDIKISNEKILDIKIDDIINKNNEITSRFDVKTVDDIFKLPESEFKDIKVLNEKRLWEQIYNKYGEKKTMEMFNSKVAGTNFKIETLLDAPIVEKTANEIAEFNASKERISKWINSEEWINRRMAATGENYNQAKVAQSSTNYQLNKINDFTMRKLNDDYIASAIGSQGYDDIMDMAVLNFRRFEGKSNKETMIHELIHGSNGKHRDYFLKGQYIPNYNEGNSVISKAHIQYLNTLPESQVRGVKALMHLQDAGIWKSGIVDDISIKYLKDHSRYSGTIPNDVSQLINNLSDNELKKYLNSVYTLVPVGMGTAGAIGVSKKNNNTNSQ